MDIGQALQNEWMVFLIVSHIEVSMKLFHNKTKCIFENKFAHTDFSGNIHSKSNKFKFYANFNIE